MTNSLNFKAKKVDPMECVSVKRSQLLRRAFPLGIVLLSLSDVVLGQIPAIPLTPTRPRTTIRPAESTAEGATATQQSSPNPAAPRIKLRDEEIAILKQDYERLGPRIENRWWLPTRTWESIC